MKYGFCLFQVHAASFFLRSAHRFLMVSPIFLRAAADSRRFLPSGLPDTVLAVLF